MSFSLSPESILSSTPKDDRAGGYVIFEGRVRNHNEGRQVLSLEYEAFDELAVAEGNRVLEEANSRFPILEAACVHRVGHLQINDLAIRVEVAAAHRREAFEACEWIVDQIKQRVPIWKKEHYAGGESGWINAHSMAREDDYYSRQTLLKEVDQQKLRSASVLIVGAGGLGCPALQCLAGAGVGHITVADSDLLDKSNLHRQTLYSHADIGKRKAELAAARLRELNPYIKIQAVPERVTASNAPGLIDEHDLVLDCTDNFATKFLLNDLCVAAGKPLIIASIYQFEGQIMVVQPHGPSLRRLWPETPDEGCIGTCVEAGVLGVVPGVFGTFQAGEALKLILGLPSPLQEGKMLILDLQTLEQQLIKLPMSECGLQAVSPGASPFEVATPDGGLLVDIREQDEIGSAPVNDAFVMSMSRFSKEGLPPADKYVLMCNRGGRSGRLARQLREQGDPRFFSLVGGATKLRNQ